MILAADCVYFEPAFPLLVQTLTQLSDVNTEILFCYKKRRKVMSGTSVAIISKAPAGRQTFFQSVEEEVQLGAGEMVASDYGY